MSEEKTNPLAEIEQTVMNVIRHAYLRPILNGTTVRPFQMSEDEITNILEPFKGKIAADMDLLRECLQVAHQMGIEQQVQPDLNDDIVIEGNTT